MNNFKKIKINKNRGWRGLAEVLVTNEDGKEQLKMIFSFSQPVWDDMIFRHTIVMQDEDYYYTIILDDTATDKLPRVDQQRSVLIKNFYSGIKEVNRYEKASWTSADSVDYNAILHFIKNRNNHTQSDWNCIGVRVIPEI